MGTQVFPSHRHFPELPDNIRVDRRKRHVKQSRPFGMICFAVKRRLPSIHSLRDTPSRAVLIRPELLPLLRVRVELLRLFPPAPWMSVQFSYSAHPPGDAAPSSDPPPGPARSSPPTRRPRSRTSATPCALGTDAARRACARAAARTAGRPGRTRSPGRCSRPCRSSSPRSSRAGRASRTRSLSGRASRRPWRGCTSRPARWRGQSPCDTLRPRRPCDRPTAAKSRVASSTAAAAGVQS